MTFSQNALNRIAGILSLLEGERLCIQEDSENYGGDKRNSSDVNTDGDSDPFSLGLQ